MADVYLAAQSTRPGSSLVTLATGDANTGYRVMNLDLGAASYDKQFSGPRGTQGSRLAGATPQNRTATWTIEVVGSTHDELEQRLSVLWALEDDLRNYGGTVTWRPNGGSYRMSVPALDSGIAIVNFDRLYWHNNRITVVLQIVCPPYWNGEPMDVLDSFSSDLLSSAYTLEAGSAGNVAVAGGVLTTIANPTVETRFVRSLPGYPLGDAQATLKATPGSTISSYKAGVVLNRADASNYVEAYVDDNATNSRIRIDKVVGGTRTNLATANLGARVSNGVAFWVRGRRERNVVYAEYFSAAPTPMGTPTSSVTYAFSAAEAALFGETTFGLAGFSWIPQQSAATLDDFELLPYTYRNVQHPEEIPLFGPLPGDAPALVDLYATASGGTNAPIFACFGWRPRPLPWNFVGIGDFEDSSLGTTGWSVAAVAGVAGAATSINRVTTASRFGAASGEIVAPATSGTGASYKINRRFKRGVTYTFEAWVRSAAQTTNLEIGLGVSGDQATTTPAALSSTWTRLTGTWTPAADRDGAYFFAEITAATATTFQIDGVSVYEGTVAPTLNTQIEGRGANPPVGVIEAEAALSASPAPTADANARLGNVLKFPSQGAGLANSSSLSWLLDPALLEGDYYVQGELAVEAWARMKIGNSGAGQGTIRTTLVADAYPETGVSYGTVRYSEEYGSAGRTFDSLLDTDAGANPGRYAFYRLGTFRLLTSRNAPLRWTFVLSVQAAVQSGGANVAIDLYFDHLLLLPANRRALSPTAKDISGYPQFIPTTAETTKLVRADLSGALAKPPGNCFPDHGLGGALLELPPGNQDALFRLSGNIPDQQPGGDGQTGTGNGGYEAEGTRAATLHLAVTPRWRLARSS